MRPEKRGLNLAEAIPGVIGVLMVAVFLGFMAVDIGAMPLFIITVVVLAMVVFDLVQTVRRRGNGPQ